MSAHGCDRQSHWCSSRLPEPAKVSCRSFANDILQSNTTANVAALLWLFFKLLIWCSYGNITLHLSMQTHRRSRLEALLLPPVPDPILNFFNQGDCCTLLGEELHLPSLRLVISCLQTGKTKILETPAFFLAQ